VCWTGEVVGVKGRRTSLPDDEDIDTEGILTRFPASRDFPTRSTGDGGAASSFTFSAASRSAANASEVSPVQT